MSVEFYQDAKQEHRWRVTDGDDIIHACHEGFSSYSNALQNLLINHASMSIFVNSIARGNADQAQVSFEEDKDQKARWRIKADNSEIVGAAHKGFDDVLSAMDNLILTYTLLTIVVAEVAQVRAESV